MKIAVIAANGKVGQLVTKEALNRGLDVTAIVRGVNKSEAQSAILKDIFSLEKNDLKDFDVVIDAFGNFNPEEQELQVTTLMHLSDLISNTNTRLLIVGGAGSLYLDESRTTQLYQTLDFPEVYIPVASGMAKGLEHLRKRNDVKWTYISPAAEFVVDGERTGEYLQRGEIFSLNDKGESIISYADYAIAMIDEAIQGNHIRERISVLGK